MNNKPNNKPKLGTGAKSLAVLAILATAAQVSDTVREAEGSAMDQVLAIFDSVKAETNATEHNRAFFEEKLAAALDEMVEKGHYDEVIKIYKEQGMEQKAKDVYLKMGQHYEKEGSYYFAHWAYASAGYKAKADECLRMALDQVLKDKMWKNAGSIYAELGDDAKASECYLKEAQSSLDYVAKSGDNYHYSVAYNSFIEAGLTKDAAARKIIMAALENNNTEYCALYFNKLNSPDLKLAETIANLAFAQNDFRLGFDTLIKAGMDDKLANLKAGEAALKNYRYEEAASFLSAAGQDPDTVNRSIAKKLADKDPKRAAAFYQSAGMERRAKAMYKKQADNVANYNPEDAVKYYQMAGELKLAAKYQTVYFLKKGDQELIRGKYFDALESYKSSGMDSNEAFIRISDAAVKNKDYADAATLYEQVGDTEKMQANARLAAQAELQRDEKERAVKLLIKAGDLDEAKKLCVELSNESSYVYYSISMLELCGIDNKTATSMVASELHKRGDAEKAEGKSFDDYHGLFFNAAKLYKKIGELELAKGILDGLISQIEALPENERVRESDTFEFYEALAKLHLAMGNDVESQKLFAHLSKRANILQSYEKAMVYYENSGGENQKHHMAGLQIAHARQLMSMGHYAQAAYVFEELGDKESAKQAFMNAASKALSGDGRYSEDNAQEFFERAGASENEILIATAKAYGDCGYLNGATEAYKKLGKYDQALKLYSKEYSRLRKLISTGETEAQHYTRLIWVIKEMIGCIGTIETAEAQAAVEQSSALNNGGHSQQIAARKQHRPNLIAQVQTRTTFNSGHRD